MTLAAELATAIYHHYAADIAYRAALMRFELTSYPC